MRNSTSPQFMYMIFVTPFGKRYGCFALKTQPDGNVVVAASFCHPMDRSGWSKIAARNVATDKLASINSNDNVVVPPVFDKQGDIDVVPTVKRAIEIMNMPSYAERAWKNGMYFVGLSKNSVPWVDMVEEKLFKDAEEKKKNNSKSTLLLDYVSSMSVALKELRVSAAKLEEIREVVSS